MCTANNNFTVEGLVAKYQNYVEEHCPKKYYAITEYGEEGLVPSLEDRAKQLLIALYVLASGNEADNTVLESLLEYYKDYNDYYTNALTEDELSFLCTHFSEVSELLFSFKKKWWGRRYHLDPFSQEKYNIAKDYINSSKGQSIFLAYSGHCDIASLFSDCTIYGFTGGIGEDETKELWVLGQIRLFALGIKSEIVTGNYTKSGGYSYTFPDRMTFDYIIIPRNFNHLLSKPLDLCLIKNRLL